MTTPWADGSDGEEIFEGGFPNSRRFPNLQTEQTKLGGRYSCDRLASVRAHKVLRVRSKSQQQGLPGGQFSLLRNEEMDPGHLARTSPRSHKKPSHRRPTKNILIDGAGGGVGALRAHRGERLFIPRHLSATRPAWTQEEGAPASKVNDSRSGPDSPQAGKLPKAVRVRAASSPQVPGVRTRVWLDLSLCLLRF